MKYLLFIAIGGASGGVSRHLLASLLHGVWEGKVPPGTLRVNVLGSFAIGVADVILVGRQLAHSDWRGLSVVSFLGAFTAFSTFSLAAVSPFEAGDSVQALAYIFGSTIICAIMAALAMQLTRTLL